MDKTDTIKNCSHECKMDISRIINIDARYKNAFNISKDVWQISQLNSSEIAASIRKKVSDMQVKKVSDMQVKEVSDMQVEEVSDMQVKKVSNMQFIKVSLIQVIVLLLILMSVKIDAEGLPEDEPCLLGSFTDVQSWVQANGELHPSLNESISMDISSNPGKVYELRLMLVNSSAVNINRSEYAQLQNWYPELLLPGWTLPFTLERLEATVFLSLARNGLDRIPLFYLNSNGTSTVHFRELRFLSFFGNNFGQNSAMQRTSREYVVMFNADGFTELPKSNGNFDMNQLGNTNWVNDLKNLNLPELLELDLRNCSIFTLKPNTFESLPSLRRLYLSHNKIYQITDGCFSGLSELVHLDLSYNTIPENEDKSKDVIDGMSMGNKIFEPLKKLVSLDFSFTKIVQTCAKVFGFLGPTVQRLSVCYTRFPKVGRGLFTNTTMKYLDISGNFALDGLGIEVFSGIETSLEILFANRVGIHDITFIWRLARLKVLSMNNNDISTIEDIKFANLKNLMILDLNNNRITNWNSPILYNLRNLHILRLASNNLNNMTPRMLEDFKSVQFVSLANNGFVCNCNLKGFYYKITENGLSSLERELEIYPHWFINETDNSSHLPGHENTSFSDVSEGILFHNAFVYYSKVLETRNRNFNKLNDSEMYNFTEHPLFPSLDDGMPNFEHLLNFSTNLLDKMDDPYLCKEYKTNKPSNYYGIAECQKSLKSKKDRKEIDDSMHLVLFLIALALVVTLGALAFWKRWYIRYFFMMLKNAAVLSVMGKDNNINDTEKVFTYDVFVSYCDEDRPWVLEELLPEVESNTPVSVCLHERDFQVGLSILENIISCMDRSRTLMMVVSNQFLLSHWCQFEMHLAQHRLLETKREQLILVLLEDIPKRRRPNTLHYLMMTKTYIVWPKSAGERGVFWKRLRKALTYGKTLASERGSSA